MKPRLKYNVIYKHRKEYPVTVMCKFFRVSRSGYYDYVKRIGRPNRDEPLAKLIIERRSQKYGRSLGCRRMQKWLEKAKGLRRNDKTVWRVMRKYSLLSTCRRKRFYRPAEALHVYPNLLDRQFHSQTPDTKWVTDITYIHTPQGTLYLSAVIDLFDRRVAAYKMSTRNDSKLVGDTIKAFMKGKTVTVERQLHSDQGCQYTASEYGSLTKQYGTTPSMPRRSIPYDNAVAESFFSMLKTECIYSYQPETIAKARALVDDDIHYYNSDRIILK